MSAALIEAARAALQAWQYDSSDCRWHMERLEAALAAAPAQAPLTDEQLSALILATVYEGDERIPYRDYWTRDIGEPFARAIERAHGIGSKA